MKKTMILAAVLTVMGAATVQAQVLGDVNGDGKVNSADVQKIYAIMAGHGPQAPAGAVAIDLGLPSGTKWANMNVGANKPEDYGDHFAWGETKPKEVYNWSTYIHCDGSAATCHDLGSDIAGTAYDVATANWGSPWKMPTLAQFEELLNNCTSEWTQQNGVYGRKFTASNANSIFLPAAGYVWGGELGFVGSYGGFWSSTPYGEYEACYLYFNSGGAYWGNGYDRSRGQSVHPVRKN